MTTLQTGYVEAHCQGLTVRWLITGNQPIGDIFDGSIGRLHRDWVEIDMIYWSNNGIRVEWNTSNSWRIPVNRLWDIHTHQLNLFFTIRQASLPILAISWEQIQRNWIETRDNHWSATMSPVHTTGRMGPGIFGANGRLRGRGRRDIAGSPLRNVLRIHQDTNPEVVNPFEGLLNHLRPFINTERTGTAELIINLIQNDEEPQILSMDQLNEIAPRINYETPEEQTETPVCPITQTEIIQGTEVRRLPCGHLFTAPSIEEWITRRNRQCPVCRQNVESPQHTDSD